jgi:hypothetical protein
VSRIVRAPAGIVWALAFAAAGCGRKGPPLIPLRPVPAAVAGASVRRDGDRVEVQFTIPATNRDGSTPPAIERVDVYARSTPLGSPRPTQEQVVDPANLVGHIGVRPPEKDKPPAPDTPPETRPGPGDAVVFLDRIPADPPKPLPPLKAVPARQPVPPVVSTIPAPPPAPPTRYLALVGVSPRGRAGDWSGLIAVPLTPPPPAPRGVVITYNETTMTVSWTPGAPGQQFAVYDVDAAGRERTGHPLAAAPLREAAFTAPVLFATERCVAIRAVELAGAVANESEAATACATPVDTFPPPAPTGLNASASEDLVVSLSWDPVTASDLAGYLILRGEGTGERLQQLTLAAIEPTAYRDTTVRRGVTYVYVVVAVDKSTPPNRSAPSASKSVTIR